MPDTETLMLLERVAEAQKRLDASLEGITLEELYKPPTGQEWSVAEIVAHVCELEPFWIGKAMEIRSVQGLDGAALLEALDYKGPSVPTPTPAPRPDLAASTLVAPHSVGRGTLFKFTLTLVNRGSIPAQVSVVFQQLGWYDFGESLDDIWLGTVQADSETTVQFRGWCSVMTAHDTPVTGVVLVSDGVNPPFEIAAQTICNPWPTPTPVVTSTPAPPPDLGLVSCQDYLKLNISFDGKDEQAIVTSYRCLSKYVDSTGKYPSRAPSLLVPIGTTLRLKLTAEQQPIALEVRLYSGAGISGSFLRWPEELPTGVEPMETFIAEPSLIFEYLPHVPPGEYSLVVRAVWEGPIDVLYAMSLALE